MTKTAYALYLWGMIDPVIRVKELQSALDTAVAGMIENRGKDISQGNVGDSSFQFASGSMTTEIWVEALSIAIRSIQSGSFQGRNVVRIKFRD